MDFTTILLIILIPGIINMLLTLIWLPNFIKKYPKASFYRLRGLNKFNYNVVGFLPIVGYIFIILLISSNLYDSYYYSKNEEIN